MIDQIDPDDLADDQLYLCPNCGQLTSIEDFDIGQLRGRIIYVNWRCTHCGTEGRDTYYKVFMTLGRLEDADV